MLGERLLDWSPALERGNARRLGGGGLGRELVLAGVGLKILELQLQLLEQAATALGAGAVLLAPELGDLQLEVRDHRLGRALPRRGGGQPRLGVIGPPDRGDEQRLERADVVRKRRDAGFHEGE